MKQTRLNGSAPDDALRLSSATAAESTGIEILADDKLRRVFGKDKVTMFEMNKHLTAHLK